jgi:hypothetical protein
MHKSLSKWKIRNLLKQKGDEKSYPVISDAIDNLREPPKMRSMRGKVNLRLMEQTGIKSVRGLEEKFYSITDNGLAAIISEESDPKNFWSYIIRVCHNRSDPIDSQTVNDLYEVFILNNLKYPSARDAILFLDELNDFYAKWLRAQKITESSIITRVLEILVSYPNVTRNEIQSRLTELSAAELEEIIQNFTEVPIPNYDPAESWRYVRHQAKKHRISVSSYLKEYIEQRRFLKRCIICTNYRGEETFQLSLFGILLFLTILLNRNFEKPRQIMFYYDKIASNYFRVLPLIFGKWSLLRDKLGNDSMFNFDVILSKDPRISRSGKSVVQHGYKELYQNARSIIQYNATTLHLIRNTGIDSLERYEVNKLDGIIREKNINKHEKNDMTKFFALYQKLNDIYEPINLAEEINLAYYLNLIHFTPYVNFNRLNMSLEEPEMHTTKWASNPATHLVEILEEDQEIREWFNKWKKDIMDFQDVAKENMAWEPERTSRYQEFTPHWYDEGF